MRRSFYYEKEDKGYKNHLFNVPVKDYQFSLEIANIFTDDLHWKTTPLSFTTNLDFVGKKNLLFSRPLHSHNSADSTAKARS
jgi:hypothetical protein